MWALQRLIRVGACGEMWGHVVDLGNVSTSGRVGEGGRMWVVGVCGQQWGTRGKGTRVYVGDNGTGGFT
jgi:hypothetical protein